MTRTKLVPVGGVVLLLALVAAAVAARWSEQPAPADQARVSNYQPVTSGSAPAVPQERRPLGTWERALGPVQVTLTFTDERMDGVISFDIPKHKGKKLRVDFRADYGVTRDSVLYGVVTSAGATVPGKLKVEPEEFLKDHARLETALLDQPFSMRFRVEDDVLVLKDIRFQVKSPEREDNDRALEDAIRSVGVGRYTKKAAASAPPQAERY
jgi:hypothetical protein